MKQRIGRVFRRAKFAAVGGAIGGAIGGVIGRNAASTGAGIGAMVGATFAEKIGPRESMLRQLRGGDAEAE